MITPNPYHNRTHKQLESALKGAMNTLQMRDWGISLESGESIPPRFAAYHENAGATIPNTNTLTAEIWINFRQCREQNLDPLETLYHELFHIWLEYVPSEELQCNILAGLMCETVVK